jgi:homocysteine S-methyltransferase
MKKNIIDKIKETPLVFDGAMGTTIYSKGVFLNTNFEELNLTKPDLIKSIHKEYVDAGADVILTNTFCANKIKLSKYGLADKVREINLSGVRLAKEASKEETYVLASIGSRLNLGSILTAENEKEIEESYREQLSILRETDVDGIMFETFFDIKELLMATRVAKEFNFPVIASITSTKELETPVGLKLEKAIKILDNSENIDILGINCSIGPHAMLSAIEHVINIINKPLVVEPNAGTPQKLDGRTIYMNTPEYFTSYCKNYIKMGVKGVGGCCGTTSAHISDMAKAVKAITTKKQQHKIKKVEQVFTETIKTTPTEEKSDFAKKLFSKTHATTIEITPPRSTDLTDVLAKVEKCKAEGIDAINLPDGPRASSRISPLVTAMMIEHKTGMETILHYCCRDRNLIGMQSDLLGGFAGGLKNYLIITGDPPKLGNYPDATAVFDVDSVGLTTVLHNLNHGIDIAGNIINPPTSVLIGVGANPCALDIEKEVTHFHNKIEAGAEYVITQPVFDVESLYRFLDRTSKFDKTIPVVAGIWPLVSYKNAMFLKTEVPGVVVPDEIISRMEKAKTKEDGIKIGLDIAREMKERLSSSVQGYQVSAPFGKVDIAINVLK